MLCILYRLNSIGYHRDMAQYVSPPRLEGNELVVHALNRRWRLDHSHNLEDLWEHMDAKDLADERIPYWAELWPSSIALVHLLAERQDELRRGLCLDLGCGCGFTALVASYLGIRTIACDYLPGALACARLNATLNGVSTNFLCMDWRAPALAAASVWRLWGADIIYERRAFAPVLTFLKYALSSNGAAYIAEPGREIFNDFLQMGRQNGWRIAPLMRQKVKDTYAAEILVTIWELCRASAVQ